MKKLFTIFCVLVCFNVQAQISISQARTTAVGQVVTIKGIVTNGAELGPVRYVQDQTAGIACYPGTGSQADFANNVLSGAEVLLTGTLIDYNGLLEISPITSYEVLSNGNPLPEPQIIGINDMNNNNEGSLVTMQGVLFDEGGNTFSGGSTYDISNAEGEAIIYLRGGHPMQGATIPLATVNLTGIVSEFNGFQLLPRSIQDVAIASSLFITESVNLKGGIQNNSLTFSWTTNATSDTKAKYGLTPALELGTVQGTTSADGLTHTVTLSGLQAATCYYIQALSAQGSEQAISNLVLASTASNSTGNIEVYFNKMVDTSFADDSENEANYYNPASIQNLIVDYINKAKETIDMCFYNNNRAAIVTALNNAVSRGVQVRYVYALSTANTALDGSVNFPKIGGNPDNLMHNKFMIVDANLVNDSYVMTGSMNLTDNNIMDDANNMLFIQDQALARVYTKEFEEFWGGNGAQPAIFSATSGSGKKANTPNLFNIGGTEVELFFSPTDNTTSNIIKAINTAQDNLQFALLSFTRNDLGTAVANAHNNGIEVRGIMESINDSGSEFEFLANTVGVDLVADAPSGQLHHKYAIIDEGSSDPQVVTGSHNWSNGAENFNDENTLIIHSQDIANIYLQEFEQRWCLANSGNCVADNGGENFIPSAIGDVKELNINLNIYPNPATNILQIDSDIDLDNYVIYDVYGKVIAGGTLKNNTNSINISYLTTGTYLLGLSNKEGKKTVTFVVK